MGPGGWGEREKERKTFLTIEHQTINTEVANASVDSESLMRNGVFPRSQASPHKFPTDYQGKTVAVLYSSKLLRSRMLEKRWGTLPDQKRLKRSDISVRCLVVDSFQLSRGRHSTQEAWNGVPSEHRLGTR